MTNVILSSVENIGYLHAHTWGWTNSLMGHDTALILAWTFRNVSIGGDPLDAVYLFNPAMVSMKLVSDMIFK